MRLTATAAPTSSSLLLVMLCVRSGLSALLLLLASRRCSGGRIWRRRWREATLWLWFECACLHHRGIHSLTGMNETTIRFPAFGSKMALRRESRGSPSERDRSRGRSRRSGSVSADLREVWWLLLHALHVYICLQLGGSIRLHEWHGWRQCGVGFLLHAACECEASSALLECTNESNSSRVHAWPHTKEREKGGSAVGKAQAISSEERVSQASAVRGARAVRRTRGRGEGISPAAQHSPAWPLACDGRMQSVWDGGHCLLLPLT